MGIFIQNRRARPRQFGYEPRYYDPHKDDDIKRRMRVQGRSRRRRKPSSLFLLLVLLLFAIFIYIRLM